MIANDVGNIWNKRTAVARKSVKMEGELCKFVSVYQSLRTWTVYQGADSDQGKCNKVCGLGQCINCVSKGKRAKLGSGEIKQLDLSYGRLVNGKRANMILGSKGPGGRSKG